MTAPITLGLHGNGERCPSCALRREEAEGVFGPRFVACNRCGGAGWIQRPDHEIAADMARIACAHYWPARERDFARHNAALAGARGHA
jgi:hypothetical protein